MLCPAARSTSVPQAAFRGHCTASPAAHALLYRCTASARRSQLREVLLLPLLGREEVGVAVRAVREGVAVQAQALSLPLLAAPVDGMCGEQTRSCRTHACRVPLDAQTRSAGTQVVTATQGLKVDSMTRGAQPGAKTRRADSMHGLRLCSLCGVWLQVNLS